jgi:hypothetical protein
VGFPPLEIRKQRENCISRRNQRRTFKRANPGEVRLTLTPAPKGTRKQSLAQACEKNKTPQMPPGNNESPLDAETATSDPVGLWPLV